MNKTAIYEAIALLNRISYFFGIIFLRRQFQSIKIRNICILLWLCTLLITYLIRWALGKNLPSSYSASKPVKVVNFIAIGIIIILLFISYSNY